MNTALRWIFLLFIFIVSPVIQSYGDEDSPSPSSLKSPFQITVQKEAPQVVRITLTTGFSVPGRIYSLTLLHADADVKFPLPIDPPKQDKDRSLLIALEETSVGTLTSPFYKSGKISDGNFENPFAKNPITDLEGQPVGAKAMGILYFMAKNLKEGIILTPSGTGKISWQDGKGFSFLLHFRTPITQWKILLGIVHVDLVHPSLDYPYLTPVFDIS